MGLVVDFMVYWWVGFGGVDDLEMLYSFVGTQSSDLKQMCAYVIVT